MAGGNLTQLLGEPFQATGEPSNTRETPLAPITFWPGDKPIDQNQIVADLRARSEAEERRELRKMTGVSVLFAQRKPRDMLRNAAPPPYSIDDVPPSIGEVVSTWARSAGYDVSGALVSAVTTAASVIDDRYRLWVRPELDWSVSARQWSFLCGPPSAGKTPALNAMTKRLKAMHSELNFQWEMRNRDRNKDEKEPVPALYTNDANTSALSEMLRANERGVMMVTNEFASWVGAIDSGDRGDAMKNRGDWLQLRDGGAWQVNRIGRGSVYVPNWGVSVLAACTPDGLAKHMKQMPEDGLIQRFVPCILAKPTEEPAGDSRGALSTWGQWLEWAYKVTTCQHTTYVNLCDEARAMFDEEDRSIKQLQKATEDFAPSYASHLGKHPGMLAEVALVFHVFSAPPGSQAPHNVLSAEVMACAIRYMRKVRRHANTLYQSILSASPAFELARALARSIVAAEVPMTTVARADMSAMCGEFRKVDDRLRREAVQLLEDADWLEANTRGTYGGWPREYQVHPQVYAMFAREGELWRARRAAVKEAIIGTE